MKLAILALAASAYIAANNLFEVQVFRGMAINPIEFAGVMLFGTLAWRWSK